MYNYEDFSEALEYLKCRTFCGMKGYDAGHYLEQALLDYMRGTGRLVTLKWRFFPLIANNFEFRIDESVKGKNLFYYSHYYDARKDCETFLKNISLVVDDFCPLVGNPHTKLCLSNILNVFRRISWALALRGIKLDKTGKKYLKYRLAFCVNFRRFLEKNTSKLSGAKVMMTLNDENYDENIFVQFCKKHDITTVALEHGHYDVSVRGDDLGKITNTLENFTSDHYFAWGEYAKRVAVENGVPADKIIMVGNAKFIGVDDFPTPSAEKVFGVVLDGGGTVSLGTNRGMLRAADALAAKYGYKYVIKHHPVYDMSLLDGAYDENNVKFICDKFMPVRDFASEVCFSIASGSSVYAELLYLRQIVFRYVHPGDIDRYRYLNGGGFSDEAGAFALVDEFESDPESFAATFKSYAEALCGKGDIGENYRRAVNDLASDKEEI